MTVAIDNRYTLPKTIQESQRWQPRMDGAELTESCGDGVGGGAKILVQAQVVERQKPQGSREAGLLPLRHRCQVAPQREKWENELPDHFLVPTKLVLTLHFLVTRIPFITSQLITLLSELF